MTNMHFSHTQLERSDPSWLEHAQHTETTRKARWLLTHDTLDGYTPTREFPCAGWLRTVDRVGDLHVCICGECGFEVTLKERRQYAAAEDWRAA